MFIIKIMMIRADLFMAEMGWNIINVGHVVQTECRLWLKWNLQKQTVKFKSLNRCLILIYPGCFCLCLQTEIKVLVILCGKYNSLKG